MDFIALIPNIGLIIFWAFMVWRANKRTAEAIGLVRMLTTQAKDKDEMIVSLIEAGDVQREMFAKYRQGVAEYDRLREDFPDKEVRQILDECCAVIEKSDTVATLRVLVDRDTRVLDGDATTAWLDRQRAQIAILRQYGKDGAQIMVRHEERWVTLEDCETTLVFRDGVCIGSHDAKLPEMNTAPVVPPSPYSTAKVARKLEL